MPTKKRKLSINFQDRLEPYKTGQVTIIHLSNKYGKEPREVRAALRDMGLRAQKIGVRRQYLWDSESKELRKIERVLRKKFA